MNDEFNKQVQNLISVIATFLIVSTLTLIVIHLLHFFGL